jgi:hypothetical protein
MRNDREMGRDSWRTDDRSNRSVEYRRNEDQYTDGHDRGTQSRSGYSQGDGSTQQRDRSTFGEHTGKGPRGYQRSDERIREDAHEALTQDGSVDASDIEVQVRDGEITLSGNVSSRQAKRAAEDCVERVSGVKDVKNQLQVSGGTNGHTGSSMSGSMGAGGSNPSGKMSESRSSGTKSSKEPVHS